MDGIELKKNGTSLTVTSEAQACMFERQGFTRITPRPPTIQETFNYRPLEKLTDRELRTICERNEPSAPWRNLCRRDYIECIKEFGWY